jgi:hypothetical protein
MKLYRYYDVQYSAGIDEWDNDLGPGRVGISLMEFEIIKETKCGVWILTGYCFTSPNESIPKEYQKFVNLNANKKYACRTKEEAKESFIARKKRQIRILSAQIERARKALVEANGI